MNAVIVIVDANSTTARRSAEVLKTSGYEVFTFPTPEKTREFMRTKHVDAVVLMANVPHETAQEVEQWREEYCSNAMLIETNEDPQHLAQHVEHELGGY
jgi:DNA-binding response OmpR family regulator